jgi:hypothetical protein
MFCIGAFFTFEISDGCFFCRVTGLSPLVELVQLRVKELQMEGFVATPKQQTKMILYFKCKQLIIKMEHIIFNGKIETWHKLTLLLLE